VATVFLGRVRRRRPRGKRATLVPWRRRLSFRFDPRGAARTAGASLSDHSFKDGHIAGGNGFWYPTPVFLGSVPEWTSHGAERILPCTSEPARRGAELGSRAITQPRVLPHLRYPRHRTGVTQQRQRRGTFTLWGCHTGAPRSSPPRPESSTTRCVVGRGCYRRPVKHLSGFPEVECVQSSGSC
jgi:hypothetical protein